MLDDLRRDLRFSSRSFRRTPVFTLAAILSIALGIAATTSVFSVVDGALFRPPPLDHPDELAMVYTTATSRQSRTGTRALVVAAIASLASMVTSFDQSRRSRKSVLAITSGEPGPINAEVVSSPYFSVLRIRPIIGRAFTADEDEAGAHRLHYLATTYGNNATAEISRSSGRTIGLNGVTLNIVGVLPRGFVGLSGRARIVVPASAAPRISYAEYLVTDQNFISVIGRLRTGVTIDRARIELERIGQAI